MSRFQLDNPFLYNIGIRQAVFWETDTKSGGGGDDNDSDNDNDSDANNPNADASTATSGSTFDMNDPSTWADPDAGSPDDDTNSLVTGSASSSSQQFFNEANQGSNFSNTQDNNPNNSPAGSPMETTLTSTGGSASSTIGPAQDNNPNAEEADNPANNNAVDFTEAPGGFGETVTGGNTSGGSGMSFGSTPVGDLSQGNNTGGGGQVNNPNDNTGGGGQVNNPNDNTGGGGQVNNPNDNTGGGGQDNNPNDNTGGSGMTFGDTPVGDLSQGNNTAGGGEGESTTNFDESSETTGAPVPYMEGDILMGTDGRPFTGTYNGIAYQSGVKIITGTEATDTSSPYNDDTLYQRNGLIYVGDPANGVLANGTIGGLNYSNGRIVGGSFGDDDDDSSSVINTGDFTFDDDGNLLQDGNLFTGEYNGQNYVNGVLQTDGDGDSVTAGGQTLTVTFPDGTVVTGTVDADGNVTDANGNVIGTWDGTTFTRSDGTTTTATLQSVTITMNDGSTLNGYLDGSGNVVDANGNVLGTINDQGQFVRAGTSVTEGGDGTVDGGSSGSVDTGYSISGGIIYDSNGNIIGYEDGYKDDTETLAENLESATGTSTAGMSRAEIIAMIEEYMMSYNNANYDPAAFMNAFGFALDPNFAGGVIPSFFEGSKAGVYMRRLVKDRDTGELRYIDVPIGGAFGSGVNSARMERRRGFGQALQF